MKQIEISLFVLPKTFFFANVKAEARHAAMSYCSYNLLLKNKRIRSKEGNISISFFIQNERTLRVRAYCDLI